MEVVAILKIFDINNKPIAILENAYAISYKKEFNAVWSASFTLPLSDPKNDYCNPLNYVEITDDITNEYIGLFRIMPSVTTRDENTTEITYDCKHVITTLTSDVLFQYHQTTNLTTRENIEYILAQQTTQNWRLGTCDFTRYFHYAWENENGLLGALFAIPEPFDEAYEWTFDTWTYPWTLNLVRPSTEPTCEIRLGKNLRGIEREVDPSNIVNRIYPLGAGEGVNALNIRDINGGKPYLENAESIAKYGLQAYVWVDRRFEVAESLKSSAQALLDKWSKPTVTYRVTAADLYELTGNTIDKFEVGAVVRIVDPDIGTVDARILSVSKADLYGGRGSVELEIGNKSDNASTTQADLQRRQEINEVYAQGATNMLVYSYNDNADANNPAVIRFYVPDDMVNINKLLLTYETSNFRAYSRATQGGGATTRSTSSGGGSTQTSSSGGGTSTSTSSGGATTRTSSAGGDHRHRIFTYVGPANTASAPRRFFRPYSDSANVIIESSLGDDLYTATSSGNHTHSISIPAHTHNFTVPNHTHSVSIPAHTHDVTIPNHTHAIEYGIYQLDRLPSAVSIKVDGTATGITELEGENIDLIAYLSKDTTGKINRGWHTVEITPNDLGRINAQLTTQFFIRSHEGVVA